LFFILGRGIIPWFYHVFFSMLEAASRLNFPSRVNLVNPKMWPFWGVHPCHLEDEMEPDWWRSRRKWKNNSNILKWLGV
jgi:hypothetical protein